ncbi:hypothetical protein RAS1_29550 [Phycisphaerae bacterium RAS1]|nr:hypothetical protein RAS1_29550 [Phycisphaerae bacterium RAS1]
MGTPATPSLVAESFTARRCRRWRRRIGASAAVLLLTLFARLVLGVYADLRIRATLAEYRTDGEPDDVMSYFAPKGLGDQNAAPLLRGLEKEIATLVPKLHPPCDPLDQSYSWHEEALEYGDSYELLAPYLQVLFDESRELRGRLRVACRMPESDWELSPQAPVIDSLDLGALTAQRRLAKFCRLHAFHAARRGDSAEAIETVFDIFGLARHTRQMYPFLIGELSAAATESLGIRTLEEITPLLQISDGADSEGGPRAVSRETIELLIDHLLDVEPSRRNWEVALHAEALSMVDLAQYFRRGGTVIVGMQFPPTTGFTPLDASVAWCMSPIHALDALRDAQEIRKSRPALDDLTYSAAVALLSDEAPVGALQLASHQLDSQQKAPVWIEYRYRADDRMAAIALAMRLFEHDHGRRPASLDVLVPDYLSALPLDPFRDAPLVYVADPECLHLYCVDEDEVDNGGAYSRKRDFKKSCADRAFFLNGDRPRDSMPPDYWIRKLDQLVGPPGRNPDEAPACDPAED